MGEGAKQDGRAYEQCENGESDKNNLQISTELKNLISATQTLFTLEFLYA